MADLSGGEESFWFPVEMLLCSLDFISKVCKGLWFKHCNVLGGVLGGVPGGVLGGVLGLPFTHNI